MISRAFESMRELHVLELALFCFTRLPHFFFNIVSIIRNTLTHSRTPLTLAPSLTTAPLLTHTRTDTHSRNTTH